MRQHIVGDGALNWFSGDDDRLVGGFEGGAPALPLFRGGGRGDGDRSTVNCAGLAADIAATPNVLLRCCSSIGAPSDNFPFRACRFVDRFRHIQRLRKPRTVKPRNGIPYLESCVFDGAGESVPGAGAAEGEEVAAGFEDAQAFGGPGLMPILHYAALLSFDVRPGRGAAFASAADVVESPFGAVLAFDVGRRVVPGR